MRWTALVSVGLSAWLVACGGEKDKDKQPPPVENQAPTAKITAPKLARTGQKITLDASKSTDPEGLKLKVLWLEAEKNPANNFLDGLDLTAAKLTFTPDVEGKFTYTVEVKDSEGLKDTATVTLEVSSDYVPPDLKAPTITAVVVNGITYSLNTNPAPVVFTTSTGVLTVKAVGTDPEDGAASIPLTTVYSANVSGNTTVNGKDFWVGAFYNAAQDDDPFGTTSFTVQVEDSDGLTSAAKTVEVRVVPRASAQLAPVAAFVDCSAIADGTGLDMTSPRNALDLGYQTAMAAGLADVFVAAGGTACKGTQVDFHGIRLWGLFDPADSWRRLTDPIDKALNLVAAGEHRYALRTTIADPLAYKLIYSRPSTYSTGSLVVDGFDFALSGFNYFAISLTTTASDWNDINISNNEFSGNVTSVSSTILATWVPGGVLIRRAEGYSSHASGTTRILRNLFAVSATRPTSRMQAWVDIGIRTTFNAGLIQFYGNVFTGAIAASPIYTCPGYTTYKQAFAFCLYTYSLVPEVARNTFWVESITSTGIPVVFSTGRGRLNSYGNVFYPLPSTQTVRLAYASNDQTVNGTDGKIWYSALPTWTTTVPHNYLFVTNRGTGNITTTVYSANGYNCILNTAFYDACGGAAAAFMSALGSFTYAPSNLNVGANQGWRLTGSILEDRFAESDVAPMQPQAKFDFDGNYGPQDNGTGTAKYNAGAFESLP